jgi:hypothetical protein
MDQPAPDFNPYTMFPVERTYSEWKMSSYNTPGGVSGTVFGGNKSFVSTCQDCHMRDITGKGCNKTKAPVRDDLPHHDLTGGNTFIPGILKTLYPAEINSAALDAGVLRARSLLQNAATLTTSVLNHQLSVRVTNETGHKLPSGYPEGRRMWLNVQAFNTSGTLIYESCHYDSVTAVLNTEDSNGDPGKIYEIKPGISTALSGVVNIPAGPSFHFVLNDTIYKDNRIPPRGFTNAAFQNIQSPPVDYYYEDGQYWDETVYTFPAESGSLIVSLYYQTTSKKYIEFLRDENNTDNTGQDLYDLWNISGKSAPELMLRKIILVEPSVNQPPVVGNIPDQTIAEGSLFSEIHLDDYVSDADHTDSEMVWNYSGNTDLKVSIDENRIAVISIPDADWYGTDTIAFMATDPGGISDSDTVIFKVRNIADAPVFVNLPDTISFMNTNDTSISMHEFIRDVDSPISSLVWELSAGGNSLEYDFNHENQSLSLFSSSSPGTVVLHVEVTDDSMLSCVDSMIIDIIPDITVIERRDLDRLSNDYYLFQNYPNPFNPVTTIEFTLPKTEDIKLKVYNIRGVEIATIASGELNKGRHLYTFNGTNLASGIYYYQLTAGEYREVKKMIILK